MSNFVNKGQSSDLSNCLSNYTILHQWDAWHDNAWLVQILNFRITMTEFNGLFSYQIVTPRVNSSEFHHNINTGIRFRFWQDRKTQLWFGIIKDILIFAFHISFRRPQGNKENGFSFLLSPSHHCLRGHLIPSAVRYPCNAARIADNKKFHCRIWVHLYINWALN